MNSAESLRHKAFRGLEIGQTATKRTVSIEVWDPKDKGSKTYKGDAKHFGDIEQRSCREFFEQRALSFGPWH